MKRAQSTDARRAAASVRSGLLRPRGTRLRLAIALFLAGVVGASPTGSAVARAATSAIGIPFDVSSVHACLARGHLLAIGRPHLDSDPPGIVGVFILAGAPWDPGQAHVSAAELFVFRSPVFARKAAAIVRSEYVFGRIPPSILRRTPKKERPLLQALSFQPS